MSDWPNKFSVLGDIDGDSIANAIEIKSLNSLIIEEISASDSIDGISTVVASHKPDHLQ